MKALLQVLIPFSLGLLLTCCAQKTTLNTDIASVDNSTNTSRIPGWHGYNVETIGEAWQLEDGIISFDKERGRGGDIVTDKEYQDFELSLEWKISECGNSGIFWSVVESSEYAFPWVTGPEMQILDNTCHPDAKIRTHRAGDLYDMIEVSQETVRPAGEWNEVKVRSKDSQIAFWLNGVEVVSFSMHDESWNQMVSDSKFGSMSEFGKAKKGRIGLQDHRDKVWFRNISIIEI